MSVVLKTKASSAEQKADTESVKKTVSANQIIFSLRFYKTPIFRKHNFIKKIAEFPDACRPRTTRLLFYSSLKRNDAVCAFDKLRVFRRSLRPYDNPLGTIVGMYFHIPPAQFFEHGFGRLY